MRIEDIDSLLSGYGVKWDYEMPTQETISVLSPPVIGAGVSLNGDVGELAGMVGMEIVANFDTGELTLFFIDGYGPGAGAGVNGGIYLAFYQSVDANSDIAGTSTAVDGTVSLGPNGLVVGRSTAPAEWMRLNPRRPYSYYIGWAPGGNLSVSMAETRYTLLYPRAR